MIMVMMPIASSVSINRNFEIQNTECKISGNPILEANDVEVNSMKVEVQSDSESEITLDYLAATSAVIGIQPKAFPTV